jgi:simple sugar transport system permease protein
MPLVILSSFVFAIIFEIFDSNSLINIDGLNYIRELLRTIPYVLSLLFLVIFSKKSLFPAALGLPFDKTKR